MFRFEWAFFAFPEMRRPNKYCLGEVNLFCCILINSLMCQVVKLSAIENSVVFSPIFVVNTKNIFAHDFKASLTLFDTADFICYEFIRLILTLV